MRIVQHEAIAVMIDPQDRLFPHMRNKEQLEHKMITLIKGLKSLSIEIILTQQYTKGLGSSIPSITHALGSDDHIEKSSFSCLDETIFETTLNTSGKKQVIIAGIESHVCVLQTAIDLKKAGYTPIVITDATSSRNSDDQKIALLRLRDEGILLSTVESILFELCRYSKTDPFKTISKLVK